ncbi:biorientation of chromosomes in cell division protein 1-like 1 isoform X1 [Glossina fuscipes]|uniref:Biorientation of chromosomes in cell division protein 1-like 1 isoform X1 n=1 Tax=Glossina fuscipes TaxID=7396 RepID=A0A9C6DUE9_9MUSC|nr:biorientation of chromosomes in cell division protein 1-like 1 isoform X1 [Glossina fuscipes]KAI9580394.1 hypothetical protein GQX74_010804 [Glossina fuscipes]
MDTQFVEKIVHEVKSQGVFDEFRKDSMADVDTKPAYQNLRKRVEDSVKKFLAEQKWQPEINKNQLREKLRRHIAESGFLDVGVERIVDQVVNPKIGSIFQPRIEEIAYKYLGIPPKKYEPPPPPLMHPLPPLPMGGQPLKVQTSDLLPNDLEQVSPDSDKATVKSEGQGEGECDMEIENDNRTQDDDDESPPFEPLGNEEKLITSLKREKEFDIKTEIKEEAEIKQSQQIKENVQDIALPAKANQRLVTCAQENEIIDTDRETSQSLEAKVSQISQLSSVSNDSFSEASKVVIEGSHSQEEAVAANISEEAQMPKFNENSSETFVSAEISKGKEFQLHFDIKKDEIKFEGTERNINTLNRQNSPSPLKGGESKETAQEENDKIQQSKSAFKFVAYNSSNSNVEQPAASSTQKSVDSFADDTTSSAPLVIASDAEVGFKDKEIIVEHKSSPKTAKEQMSCNTSTTTTTEIQNTMTSPVINHVGDKEYFSTKYSSSLSSKYKKHAKEHRRSHDKERDHRHSHSSKDSKDERSKDRYHHRSSSSGSSGHNKHSSSKTKHSSSSATRKDSSKNSKHSSSLSTEKDKQRYHQYKESSCSSTTSSKRSERKDDHSEVKTKLIKRKSTDSNDDNDKSSGTYGTPSVPSKPSNQATSSSGKSKPRSNSDTKKTSTTKTNAKTSALSEPELRHEHQNKVVILNDILENPQTNFIDLDVRTSSEAGVHVTVSTKKAEIVTSQSFKSSVQVSSEKDNEINEKFSSDLFFFEDRLQQFNERLKLLDVVIDSYRRSINNFRFDPAEREYSERFFLSHDDELHNNNNRYLIKKVGQNYSTIHVDNTALQQQLETTPCKRFKLNEVDKCTVTAKTSPISSDSGSINSKENEIVDKNKTGVESNSKSVHLKDRLKTVQKLTQQQRYTSEDLYKPRPILGQRSRRRGVMDTVL